MKKYLPIILAVLLTVGLLGGCTGDTAPAPNADVTATPGNTPNVSPDTPNDSIFEDNDAANNNTRGIIGDMGNAAGDIAGDVGRAARDIGDDLMGGHHDQSGTEPTAGADHGVTTKR